MDKRLEKIIDLKLKELEERDASSNENLIKELVICEDWETYKDIKERYNL